MNEADSQNVIHDIAYGKFIHLLVTKYRDVELTDGQIYKLYKTVFSSDLKDIIGTGASEDLPF